MGQIGNALPLKVIPSVDVEKDFDLTVTDLNPDSSNNKFKNFHNSGDGGITFKINVIIDPNESWGYGKVGQADFVYLGKKYPARARPHVWLNTWFVNMTPLYVVSDAIDIPNGKYILSANPSRKQDFRYYTEWSLEFTTYRPLNINKWQANQSLSKYTGITVSATAKNTELANCDLSLFVYCKKKTTTTQATRWLQEALYKLGFLPSLSTTGWYNDDVLNAVKSFQKKYQKYFSGMKVTGKMDKVTLNAICSF